MIKLKVWHWLLLMIFLPFVIGSKCSWFTTKEDFNPPPQSCGVGEGEFGFGIADSIPWEFDCNYTGSFQIQLEPSINNSYAGFNRLYFTLKKGSSTYRSNYVEFYSNQEGIQQLEWGGSLPSGEYEANAFLENIQLNSTCRDSIYEDWKDDLGKVDITQFTNPSKVMVIEYFCQTSYNVFSSPNTEEYMDIAFNIASTTYNVITYYTDLTPELIRDTITAVEDYIYSLKDWPEDMFLCGVKGFKDRYGNFLVNILGFTPQRDPYNFTPNCSTGSLVAVKACIDVVADKYKIDYNDFVTATTIHELGWQRAISYYDSHDSEFCIMNVGLVVIGERNRYSNPHFCNSCITKIKNVNW